LAVADLEHGPVQLVDVERMRALGTIQIGADTFVESLHWVRRDLILVSLGNSPSSVAALNPITRQVLSVRELGGTMLWSEPAGDSLVFLVAPSRGIGVARLVDFDGARLRSVALTDVDAGWSRLECVEEDCRGRQSVPALAVHPSGTRALVVPSGNRVAEVDLRTMQARYHDLSEPVSLLGRLLDWLEPSAHAKGMIDGPERNAVWLPTGLVAVSGVDSVTKGDQVDVTPTGLSLIDPSDWSVRRVSDEPSSVTFRGGMVLGSSWTEGTDEQTLTAFSPEGAFRFSLAREGSDLTQVGGRHLYATTHDGTQFEIIDLETGKTVGRAAPRRETWLLATDD
jgi:hypothetical protein